MKLSLLTIACAFALNTYSQAPTIQWQKGFSGSSYDAAISIKHTTDGGYITAGYTESANGDFSGNHGMYDGWIAKLDVNGNTQWMKTVGGSNEDELYYVIQTTDGGYIAAGSSYSNDGDVSGHHGGSNQKDCWIIKFDGLGNIQWQKSLGGTGSEYANSIEQTNDGGYIINAASTSTNGDLTSNHGILDVWVIKTDSVGNIQWQKTYGGSRFDHSRSMFKTNDGGYIIASRSYSNNGDVTQHIDSTNVQNGWVLKISSSGSIDWEKSILDADYTWLECIKQTSDNGFIIVGHSAASDSMTSPDGLIIKLDVNGILQWKKTYGGTGFDDFRSVIENIDGSYTVAGHSTSSNGDLLTNYLSMDFWCMNLDSQGNIIWKKSFGGSDLDYTYSIQQTNDNGFILAAHSYSKNGDVTTTAPGFTQSDAWIAKFNPLTLSTGITENHETNSFLFYPNPATDVIHINTSITSQNEPYTLINSLGQTVLSGELHGNDNTIDIQHVASGVYSLQVGKQKQTYKIIKN